MGLLEAKVVQELIEVINENSTRQDASADILVDADARAQRVKMQIQTYARTKVLVI
ncbi:MAG: hypothetical protein OSB34_08810 [Planktomarina sp.]|nr:hypothetical protein [Planktomarina sp.]